MTRRPYRLAPGATVGVIATGFAVPRDSLDRGLERLEGLGYRAVEGEHLRRRHGYLAGTDEQRASDLDAMLTDRSIDAIWFARGGYGTARLLEGVRWASLRRRPKLLIGYSDLTALFAPVVSRTGQVCIYGPGVSELADGRAYHARTLNALLANDPIEWTIRPRDVVAPGRARGQLNGGNLVVLNHLCGTRFFPDLDGRVLFFEEVGEQVYRIDRMLTQLRDAGHLQKLAAVLIGHMQIPARTHFPPDRRLIDVLREALVPLGIPVVRGVPTGHRGGSRPLPLGGDVRIDTRAGRIRIS